MEDQKTYILVIDEENSLAFYKLYNLCSVIHAEKKYQVIRRALDKGKIYKFKGYIIKATGEAKIKYEVDGKLYDKIQKSKRSK